MSPGHGCRSRRLGASTTFVVLLILAATAQAFSAPSVSPNEIAAATFTLSHQSVEDAAALVLPLLGPDGNVRIVRATNSMIVRDVPARLNRVRAQVTAFDHPPQPLRVELELLRTGGADDATALHPPAALERRLRQLFRFDEYRMVASGDVLTREGEEVKFQAAGRYEVTFRSTAVMPDGRLVLNDFSLWRRGGARGDQPLLRSRLQLTIDRPLVLGLTRVEGDREALFLALTCHHTAQSGPGG